MTHAREMLETHPRTASIPPDVLIEAIEACFDCAQSCTTCADACLGEEDVQNLIACIRRCSGCADVCVTTGRELSRQTESDLEIVQAVLTACVDTCRECAEECERHAPHHEHCRICATVCRRCEEACRSALSLVAASVA